MRGLAVLFVLLACAAPARAQQGGAVVVTPGSAQAYKAAVQTFAERSSSPNPGRPDRFRTMVEEALEFSSVFDVLSQRAFLGPTQTLALGRESVLCSDWTQIGADALVEGEIRVDTELAVEFRVWDTSRCRSLLRKRYSQSAGTDPRKLARRIADDVVGAFTGQQGVASTEIAFVSTRKGNREIFVMGADGSDARAATANRSINAFPNWSPDGDAIVYTSYRYRDTPLLFLSSRGKGRPGRLLHRLNGGYAEYRGVFAPQGSALAVVLSPPGGSSDVYTVALDGAGLQRLTRNRAIDVSPAWSPDGSRIAFVSDRSGAPQVYLMNADGSNQQRLTYQGTYNTSPAWSPDGRWIAYESRVGGQFDIWVTDVEGTVSWPLVQHPRSDEGPAWAPNSQKVAFSSKRRGRADIYLIDLTGENLLRITQNEGDNTSPAWGPYPR